MKTPRRRQQEALEDALAQRPVDATLPGERHPTRRLVTAKVIAQQLGVTEEHVARRWRQYPFAVPLSKRVIRYDPVLFDEFLERLGRERMAR